jgi:hypothetical protein
MPHPARFDDKRRVPDAAMPSSPGLREKLGVHGAARKLAPWMNMNVFRRLLLIVRAKHSH